MRRTTTLALAAVLAGASLQCSLHPEDSATSASALTPVDCLTLRGGFVRAADWPGGLVTVSCAGATTAALDGVAAVPGAGGSFVIAPRPGLDVLHVEGPGMFGGKTDLPFLYGDFAPPGSPVTDAIAVRVNASGWSSSDGQVSLPLAANEPLDLSDVGTQVLRDQGDLLAGLDGQGADVSGTGIFGIAYEASVTIDAVSYDASSVAVAVVPRDGGVTLTATIPSPAGQFSWTAGAAGVELGDTVTATADALTVSADVDLAYADDDGSGHPGIRATLGDHHVALQNLQIGTLALDALPVVGASVEQALGGGIEWLFNQYGDPLLSLVQSSVVPAVTASLAQLHLPSQVQLPGGLGAYGLSADFDGASFAADGSQFGVAASVAPAGAIALASPGFLAAGPSPASFDTAPPFGVSLSLDMVNEALHAVWAQGTLKQTVLGPKKLGGGVTTDPLVAEAKLPAVVRANDDGSGASLALGELEVSTVLHGLPKAGDVPLRLALTLVADADVALGGDGASILVTLDPKRTTVLLDVVDLPTQVQGAVDYVTKGVNDLLPELVQAVSTAFAPPPIPVPAVDLARLSPAFAGRSGAFSGDLAIGGATQRIVLSGDLVAR